MLILEKNQKMTIQFNSCNILRYKYNILYVTTASKYTSLKPPTKPNQTKFNHQHCHWNPVSRLITMNYAFTKSICIPAGSGSGMVIPVSCLCCWKTEGLWCLFLLFLPSLLFKALLELKSPTPSSEWGAQERLTTPLRSSGREALQTRAW